MRRPRDENKFDFKEMIDLVKGFNSSVMRITAISDKEIKRTEVASLGQRMVKLGTKIQKVKTTDL